MKILVAFRGIPGRQGWSVGEAVCRALRMLGHQPIPYGTVYDKDAKGFGPRIPGSPDAPPPVDAIIYTECNDSNPQYAELAALKVPKLYWEFDTAMHLEAKDKFLRLMKFDHVFMANSLLAARFKADGIHYLPYGYDSVFLGQGAPAGGKANRAVLVGSPFPERVEFCRAAGVELVSGFGPAYVRALQDNAIQVHSLASGGNGLLVARVWDALGCGACLVTENDSALLQHFVEGEHLVTYTSADGCRSAVEWLTRDVAARQRIAAAGLAEAKAKHTYVPRMQEMLTVLE